LPQLLQLPIWFALYTSLSTNVELFHSPFITPWTDLSAPDPFFSLPLALGALMILQQKITPTTMDPVQAKMMMYVMPIMFTGMMLFLPSGLCLYMLTNSALGIAQQKWIDSRLKRSAAKLTPEPVAATAPAAAAEVLADSSPTAQRSSTRIKPRNKPGRARRGRA